MKHICMGLVLISVLHHQVPLTIAEEISVEGCDGKKFAVLDLSDLSKLGGFPSCELHQNVQVNAGNGIVYSTRHDIEHKMPHMFGTHAAPWYLSEAIKASQYYTSDINAADIIFVYDYCYYISWLADVHSFGREHDDGPGDHLFQAYHTMLQLPAWKKHNGAQFAFYDSHPGFMAGKAAQAVKTLMCVTFRNAIHLLVDTPMRNVCEGFWLIRKILVTPYAPNLLNFSAPEAYLQLPYVSSGQRELLAYNRAKCHPYLPEREDDDGNAGKLMRYWFSYIEWGTVTEVDVKCTDPELNPEGHIGFSDMFLKMRNAKFCIAFPGDAASTRRLSEIFLAGCIPVFIGPPYHSMPFGDTIPYAKLGLFFNIRNHSMWLKHTFPTNWKLHPTIRAVHETEARWWVPDVYIPKPVFIEVDQPADVLAHIRNVPKSLIEEKLKLMHEFGSRFSFQERVTTPPNAINSLLSGMCIKQDANY